MIIRKARIEEIDVIEVILNHAKQRMYEIGIDQWQNGYPNKASILNDFDEGSLYVFVENETIVGTTALQHKPDPNYEKIDGAWISDERYITLHRFAVAALTVRKGIATNMIKAILIKYPNENIRIDTHCDNIPMKRLLEKNKFIYCGVIRLADNSKRDAYELVAKQS